MLVRKRQVICKVVPILDVVLITLSDRKLVSRKKRSSSETRRGKRNIHRRKILENNYCKYNIVLG